MEPTASRILVVEDDSRLAEELVCGLRARGFAVELSTSGEGVVAAVLARAADLLLLDLMLPGLDGIAVLEALKGRSSCPVIVLSARTDLPSRVKSFDSGAVDYVPKPFFFAELARRIDVRLGRALAPPPARVFRWAGAALNAGARELRIDDAPVHLTPFEFNVLLYLVERGGRALTRRQIAQGALSLSEEIADRTVDSHVARVRAKIGADAAAALRTVWGVGYSFDPAGGG